MMIQHRVYISTDKAIVDGKALELTEKGSALLTQSYRSHIGDYPKFFKWTPCANWALSHQNCC